MMNVWLEVTVSRSEYAYRGNSNHAEARLVVTEEILENADLSSLWRSLLEKAVAGLELAEAEKALAEAEGKLEAGDG